MASNRKTKLDRKTTSLEFIIGCVGLAILWAAISWSNFFWILLVAWVIVCNRAMKAADRRAEDQERAKQKAILDEESRLAGLDAQLVCPHCHVRGHVTTNKAAAKKLDNHKAAWGLFTGGVSLLFTDGMSKIINTTNAACANCGSSWQSESQPVAA